MSSINIQQKTDCQLIKGGARPSTQQLDPKGTFHVVHMRDGSVLLEEDVPNGIVDEGKDHLLGAVFDNETSWATWYCGLIDLTGYTALDATDTYDDIDQAGNGWDEYPSYTDGNNGDSAVTRPEWQTDAPSGESITNSTTSVYDITVNGTVKGLFIVGGTGGAVNKSDHAAVNNILWSTALFGSGDVAVLNGDQLKITYTISA